MRMGVIATIRPWRVALGFMLGGVGALLIMCATIEPSWFGLGTARASYASLIIEIGFFIGGFVGGLSLSRGWEPAAGFGAGSLLIGPMLIFSLMGMPPLSWKDMAIQWLAVTVYSALAFGLAGALGAVSIGKTHLVTLVGAGTFAAGGAIGATFMTLMNALAMGTDSRRPFIAGMCVEPILAYFACGGLFAGALRAWERRHLPTSLVGSS
jgi:hypothetical protein